jgi:hypothetical protein
LHALIRERGWKLIDLAWWLGVGRSTLYDEINDKERTVPWNLALLNIPLITHSQLMALRHERLASQSKAKQRNVIGSGLAIGDELVALRHIGELADEGDHATIEAIIDGDRPDAKYLLRFAAGADWFPAEMIDKDFAETGRHITGNVR